MGKALARAENSIQITDAIEDLNVKLDKTLGPRVSSYRYLALAMADLSIEDYAHSLEALKKATSSDKHADRAAVRRARRVGVPQRGRSASRSRW